MKESCRIALKVVVVCVVLLLPRHVLPASAGAASEKPTFVALTLGTEEGDVTIVVPDRGAATHRNYEKGLYFAFVPTVRDVPGGDVDIKVFALRDDDSGAPKRVGEVGQISAKLGYRDVVAAVPGMDVTVVAIGDDLRALTRVTKVTGRQCASAKASNPLVNANGCCVSCGGSTSCGCAVGGGCGSCCGGCCGWTF